MRVPRLNQSEWRVDPPESVPEGRLNVPIGGRVLRSARLTQSSPSIRNGPVTPAVTTRNVVRSSVMADTRQGPGVLRECPTCEEVQRMDPRAIYCSPGCKQAANRLRSRQGAKRQRCMLRQVTKVGR